MPLTLKNRQPYLRPYPLVWSIAANLGARVIGDFNFLDHGTANMTDDGGGLTSQWKDRKTGLALNAAGAARPTWVSGKGVFFNGANYMASTGVGPLPTGANSGSIWWVGTQLALDPNPRNLVSYGTSPQQRVVRVNYVTHRPGATTTSIVLEDTSKFFVERSVIGGKFANGMIHLRHNGQAGGSAAAALTTGTSALRFGSDMAGTPARYAIAYYRRVLFIAGNTSVEEDTRIEAELLGTDAYDIMPAGHRYRPRRAAPTFAANLAAINAMIAAAPASTPDQESDMASPPTVAAYNGAPNPAVFPQGADIVDGRALISLRQGWLETISVYVASTMGLLGHVSEEFPELLYPQTTSFRAGSLITSRHVAVYFYGVVDTKIRVIVRPVADAVGKYVARAGHTVAGATGSNTMTFDFGSVAQREIIVEIPGSNMFAGFYVEAGGLIEPLAAVPDLRIGIFSDSFGSGVGATARWSAFTILLGDRLGITSGQFAGNSGGGWENGNAGIYTMTQRIPDVNDSDLTERNSLGITALSNLKFVVIPLGVNDAGISHTREEWKTIVKTIVQPIRDRLPFAPIILVGPWDNYYPLAVSAGWAAVDGGIQDAAAEITGCTYLSMEGVYFEMLGGGNIHPTDLGHAQIADNLKPRIATALGAM